LLKKSQGKSCPTESKGVMWKGQGSRRKGRDSEKKKKRKLSHKRYQGITFGEAQSNLPKNTEKGEKKEGKEASNFIGLHQEDPQGKKGKRKKLGHLNLEKNPKSKIKFKYIHLRKNKM